MQKWMKEKGKEIFLFLSVRKAKVPQETRKFSGYKGEREAPDNYTCIVILMDLCAQLWGVHERIWNYVVYNVLWKLNKW